MFFYRAYGLGIQSEIALPELPAGEGVADVTIASGCLAPFLPEAARDRRFVRAAPNEVYLHWPWAGGFLARGGAELIYDPLPGADERALRLLLLGACLATLLHQRGLLTLHAGVVRAGGGAVAFLGWKGSGKSTMAGAMVRRGFPLAADDIAPIQFSPAGPLLLPGFPQLKLWPDSAQALGENADALPRLHPRLEKRARATGGDFSPDPLPLRRLYLLAAAEAMEIAPLPPQEAFCELMRHSYANHPLYQNKLLEGTQTAARHLAQCASLIAAVPVRRLGRPLSLPLLPEVVRAVEADLE